VERGWSGANEHYTQQNSKKKCVQQQKEAPYGVKEKNSFQNGITLRNKRCLLLSY
jgi:hypothetical protein